MRPFAIAIALTAVACAGAPPPATPNPPPTPTAVPTAVPNAEPTAEPNVEPANVLAALYRAVKPGGNVGVTISSKREAVGRPLRRRSHSGEPWVTER